MGHKFNPASLHKLDNSERRKRLPPEEILKRFGLLEGDLAADIGCGNGYFTLPASLIVGETGAVFALDILQEMLALVEEKVLLEKRKNIRCVKVKEASFGLDSGGVTFAMAFFVLHEADCWQAFLAEIHRILKPGGRVALIEWDKRPMEQGPPPEHRLAKEEVIQALKDKGFLVEEVAIGAHYYGLLAKKSGV